MGDPLAEAVAEAALLGIFEKAKDNEATLGDWKTKATIRREEQAGTSEASSRRGLLGEVAEEEAAAAGVAAAETDEETEKEEAGPYTTVSFPFHRMVTYACSRAQKLGQLEWVSGSGVQGRTLKSSWSGNAVLRPWGTAEALGAVMGAAAWLYAVHLLCERRNTPQAAAVGPARYCSPRHPNHSEPSFLK